MKNGDKPAMPCNVTNCDSEGVFYDMDQYQGLTKRELFAKDMLAAIISNPATEVVKPEAVKNAVKLADALLEELDK